VSIHMGSIKVGNRTIGLNIVDYNYGCNKAVEQLWCSLLTVSSVSRDLIISKSDRSQEA
jgi:hypothetical protein